MYRPVPFAVCTKPVPFDFSESDSVQRHRISCGAYTSQNAAAPPSEEKINARPGCTFLFYYYYS